MNVASDAPTIVLIHGFGFDRRIWSPVELAFDGFNVIYLSLPGFGENPEAGDYTIEGLASDFWAGLTLAGQKNIHLIGHSMGGYVSMEMISQQPERVSSLTLVHSHVFADSEQKKSARSVSVEDIKTNGRASTVRKMISSLVGGGMGSAELAGLLIERGMQYTDDAWIAGLQAIRDRKDHAETLSGFTAPVMMIMGEQDNAVPVDLAYKQCHLAAQTTLHIYPGTGHLAMYENTMRMIRDLRLFFQEIQ